ncbi:YdcF family protein [Aerococcaceae bacterium WGS1372]
MKKKMMILLSCLIILWTSHAVWLYGNLDVGEQAVLSDIIVVPEGGDGREERAVELLLDGYSESDKVIVSPLYVEEYDLDLTDSYLEAGAELSQLIPENEATSTYTNAVNTLQLMEEYGWDSALIVTSDYHTRRTKMIYERVNRDYNFELTYIAAYHNWNGEVLTYFDARELREAGRREIYKYYGYLIGLYHFIDLG